MPGVQGYAPLCRASNSLRAIPAPTDGLGVFSAIMDAAKRRRVDVPKQEPGKQYDAAKLAGFFKDESAQIEKGYEVLRDLDLVVLDNSIRESTVAQLRGHTIENKWKVYEEVKKCGFQFKIVASFSHMTRVDDVFVKELCSKPDEDKSGLFAFSEIVDSSVVIAAGTDKKDNVPPEYFESIPLGMAKLEAYGVPNVIIEIDLSDGVYNFNPAKFPMAGFCELLKTRIIWSHEHLHKDSKVLVNFRDLPDVMRDDPKRVIEVVGYLANLPATIRPLGLIFEDANGGAPPSICGAWTKYIRKAMDDFKWKGYLLAHIHERFGLAEACVQETLMNGCNGIWASVCIEGAFMGHASSIVTILNLIRLGNKKVLEKYNCSYLRKAAINVTRITTGVDPHPKQPIYGARALDYVFDLTKAEFDLAEFFDERPVIRISTLASDEMICVRMASLFGRDDERFTIERAQRMKEVMLEDLRSNRKEEYMSPVGLAVLFDRAGGSLTAAMSDAIADMKIKDQHGQRLIAEVRKMWDVWDLKEEHQKDDMLEYDSFYNGFMAPFFACYRCKDTKRALRAIDMDADGQVDWNEFAVYLKWAFRQYPTVKDAEELLDVAFRKGIIPAMRDELIAIS